MQDNENAKYNWMQAQNIEDPIAQYHNNKDILVMQNIPKNQKEINKFQVQNIGNFRKTTQSNDYAEGGTSSPLSFSKGRSTKDSGVPGTRTTKPGPSEAGICWGTLGTPSDPDGLTV